MELHFLHSSTSSLTSITYCSSSSSTSIKAHTQNPIHCLRLSKRSSGPPRRQDPKKELSRILRKDAAVKSIERKANSNKYNNLWPKALLEALNEAVANNLWDTALKIFGLLRKQKWYEPRCQTYAKLLMMLGKCKQPEQAGLLFELMLTDGLKPTVDVYTALVSVYGKSGLFDKALSTINGMKSASDCKPDVYTYSILINCCTKFRRYDLIEQVLAEMSYLGIGCNTVIYNTLIDGYGKAEMFELMEDSLTDMIESGSCHPDVFTFNSFLGTYGNSGRIDMMEKWYDEFQLMGIKPDLKTFNVLIKSYGKAGMYEKMGSVMEFMEKRFFIPTIVTYNIVIEVFGKAGNLVKMEEYFRKMKYQGMKPNCITYCSLVSAYSKAGNIVKVDSVLRQVENSDVILDTAFFNCIISAYGRAGDINKMGELFLAMEERKCKPDHITFATMIQACDALGMAAAAEDLKKRMIANKNSGTRLIEC